MIILDGQPFTEGQAPYVEFDPDRRAHKQAIYIEVILPIDVGMRVYAMVDTGSPYCIFDTELTEALGLGADNSENSAKDPVWPLYGNNPTRDHPFKSNPRNIVRYRCQYICTRRGVALWKLFRLHRFFGTLPICY